MSIEKPENSHLKIVHIKGSQDSKPKEIGNDLNPDYIDFSTPQEITPEFLEKIEFPDPEIENEKKRLLDMHKSETDPEKKKQIEFALRQLFLS